MILIKFVLIKKKSVYAKPCLVQDKFCKMFLVLPDRVKGALPSHLALWVEGMFAHDMVVLFI